MLIEPDWLNMLVDRSENKGYVAVLGLYDFEAFEWPWTKTDIPPTYIIRVIK